MRSSVMDWWWGLEVRGDKQQTYFTIQTLASILQRMGVEISAERGAKPRCR